MSSSPNETNDNTSLMRQKLLTAEEVYLYKIPPLKNANGHRAEDWNLGSPLQTCSLLVERRGDQLVLEFKVPSNNNNNTAAVFAAAVIDCTIPGRRVQHWLEQVVDSSRYFTLKISGGGKREAMIGFGFRDREVATDLRESMQHYEAALRRERQGEETSTSGSSALQYSIPPLAAGEKIHVNTGREGGGGGGAKKSPSSSGGTSVPLLLKKPPPSASAAAAVAVETPTTPIEKLTIDLAGVNLDEKSKHAVDSQPDQEVGDESSGGAVFEGDDDDWETEFRSA